MDAVVKRFGYNFITSYHVDLNPFFKHNAFPKNILAFNALKNAVLAVDPRYHYYFMDSMSAYTRSLTSYHKTVLEPVDDGISPHFVLKVPQVTVAYMSFLGCTQEDSIVCRKGVDAFNCCRFYTIRVKIEADGLVRFHPMEGSDFLGTVVHHGETLFESYPFLFTFALLSSRSNPYASSFPKPRSASSSIA